MCYKTMVREFLLILAGSIVYGLSTVLFIFPADLLLGGTSGISVILNAFLPFSSGMILMAINFTLVIAAFLILGKGMAVKTLIGSVLTTASIGIFEGVFALQEPVIANPYLSAAIGAAIIACSSGIMFYVDSSSGGTDIIALIIRNFSNLQIGKALLVTDILIVIVGGILSGKTIFFSSVLGLLIKTLGIDLVIHTIVRLRR